MKKLIKWYNKIYKKSKSEKIGSFKLISTRFGFELDVRSLGDSEKLKQTIKNMEEYDMWEKNQLKTN